MFLKTLGNIFDKFMHLICFINAFILTSILRYYYSMERELCEIERVSQLEGVNHGEEYADYLAKPDTSKNPKYWDLTDDFQLRFRNKKVHSMSHDDEIAFLITDTYSIRGYDNDVAENWIPPFGYGSTGAVAMARRNKEIFRKIFLATYQKSLYVKTTLDRFLILQRRFVFNFRGQVLIEKLL